MLIRETVFESFVFQSDAECNDDASFHPSLSFDTTVLYVNTNQIVSILIYVLQSKRHMYHMQAHRCVLRPRKMRRLSLTGGNDSQNSLRHVKVIRICTRSQTYTRCMNRTSQDTQKRHVNMRHGRSAPRGFRKEIHMRYPGSLRHTWSMNTKTNANKHVHGKPMSEEQPTSTK